MDYYKFIVSPENIKGDLSTVNYEGTNVGVYSAMTQVLTGGTNGGSLLTGLSVNILITQTAVDVGYFSPFDGAVLQKECVANFIFSSTTEDPYTYYVYNTSNEFNKFLELSVYTLNWGDASSVEIITTHSPQYLKHTYPKASSGYTITLEQSNPWGVTRVSKDIQTPFKNVEIINPNGTAIFIPKGGNWSGTPISYDYIFSGDAENTISAQTSNNFVTVPFTVSGLTKSRITELMQYGPQQYVVGAPVIANGQIWGVITNTATTFTAYTITGIDYYDFIDGTSIFFEQSSGFTEYNLSERPITKEEVLTKVIDQPQILSSVYVERGKNSAYESVQRLGEVDNLGDMINYGYGFFKVEKKG